MSDHSRDDDREKIFIVRGKIPATQGRKETPGQFQYEAFVRARDEAGVRTKMDAFLAGTNVPYTVEPALVCGEDNLTNEIERKAKMLGYELHLRAVEASASREDVDYVPPVLREGPAS